MDFTGMQLKTGSRKVFKRYRERKEKRSGSKMAFDGCRTKSRKAAKDDEEDNALVWAVRPIPGHVATTERQCTKPSKKLLLTPKLTEQSFSKAGCDCPFAAMQVFGHMFRKKRVPNSLESLLSASRSKKGPKWCVLPEEMFDARAPRGTFRCFLVRVNRQLIPEPLMFIFAEAVRPFLSLVPLCMDDSNPLPNMDVASASVAVLRHAIFCARRRVQAFSGEDGAVLVTAHQNTLTVFLRGIEHHQVRHYDSLTSNYCRAEFIYPSKAVETYVKSHAELKPFTTPRGL